MYKILGGDGKEYGPISADTLRQWVVEGRANAQTQVQPDGSTGWQALGSLPEFAAQAGASAAAPAFAAASAPVTDTDGARSLAVPVGWALTILGVLGVLMGLGLIAFYLLVGMPNSALLTKLMPQQGAGGAQQAGQLMGAIAGAVFGILWSGFVIIAGIKMRQLKSWGLVLAGAIMAAIPCCGGQILMCFPGLPVGIWAIVILCKPNVKSAFT